MHGYVATYLVVNTFEVEAGDGGELVAEVVVGGGGGSFHVFVGGDFGFFAGFAGFFGNEVGNGAAVDGEGFELVEGFAAVGYSEVEELAGEGHEAFVFGHEVGFAVESDNGGEVAFVFSEYAAFGGGAVFAFGGYGLAFFAEDFHGFFDVAVGFCQGFFAVHQTGRSEVAQFGDFCHCYCHISSNFCEFNN